MKKKMVSFVAVLLVVCMLPLSTFAAAVQPRAEFYVTMYLAATEVTGLDSISQLSVGHAFLIFYNDSDFSIRVGHMTVEEGDFVTIGSYGNRDAHRGIWYNIEAYRQPSSVYAYGRPITSAQLESINNTINSRDSYSLIDNNCCHFAVDVWNTGLSNTHNDLAYGGIPELVVDSIQSKAGHITNYDLPSKSIRQIAYHTVTGLIYDQSEASS